MDKSNKPARPMRFPYTTSAQIMQFPFRYYYENSWLFKYFLFASVVAAPIFWKIQKLSKSEENQRIWYEKRWKEFYGGHDH